MKLAVANGLHNFDIRKWPAAGISPPYLTACMLLLTVEAIFAWQNTQPECVTVCTSHVAFVDW